MGNLLACTVTLVSSAFLSTSTADSYQGPSSTRGVVTICALLANLMFVGFFLHSFMPAFVREQRQQYWAWKIGKTKAGAARQLVGVYSNALTVGSAVTAWKQNVLPRNVNIRNEEASVQIEMTVTSGTPITDRRKTRRRSSASSLSTISATSLNWTMTKLGMDRGNPPRCCV